LAQIPAAWLRCFAGAFTVEVRLASRDFVYPVPLGGALLSRHDADSTQGGA
jgi:hypothetical protein